MDPDEIILFIGGPYDGKRKRWGTSQFSQKVLTMTLGDPLEDIYRIKRYRDASTVHYVAIHEGVMDVMKELIDGYRKEKK